MWKVLCDMGKKQCRGEFMLRWVPFYVGDRGSPQWVDDNDLKEGTEQDMKTSGQSISGKGVSSTNVRGRALSRLEEKTRSTVSLKKWSRGRIVGKGLRTRYRLCQPLWGLGSQLHKPLLVKTATARWLLHGFRPLSHCFYRKVCSHSPRILKNLLSSSYLFLSWLPSKLFVIILNDCKGYGFWYL